MLQSVKAKPGKDTQCILSSQRGKGHTSKTQSCWLYVCAKP